MSLFKSSKPKRHDTIRVEFWESNQDAPQEGPMAQSDVPIGQLPDTFEIDTVLDIGPNKWRVIQAIPSQKTEFQVTGKLALTLVPHEVVMMDPNEILYSLPTISEDFAPVEDAQDLNNMLVLREDDWRTAEFISTAFAAQIDEEIAAIAQIYENHREGAGFNSLHVRGKIPAPLTQKTLTPANLRAVFGEAKSYAGVAFSNAAATLVNGFAFETKTGRTLWGTTDAGGHITVLNFQGPNSESDDETDNAAFAAALNGFLKDEGLYLVVWPRGSLYGMDRQNYEGGE